MKLEPGYEFGIKVRSGDGYTMVKVASYTHNPPGYHVTFIENPIAGETTWLGKEFTETWNDKYIQFKRYEKLKYLLKP